MYNYEIDFKINIKKFNCQRIIGTQNITKKKSILSFLSFFLIYFDIYFDNYHNMYVDI